MEERPTTPPAGCTALTKSGTPCKNAAWKDGLCGTHNRDLPVPGDGEGVEMPERHALKVNKKNAPALEWVSVGGKWTPPAASADRP